MGYLSFAFFFFLCIALIVYYIIPPKARWIFLLICSIGFYLSYDFRCAFLLCFSVGTIYISALLLEKYKKNKSLIIWACIVTNILTWFITKDLNWYIGLLSRVLAKFGLASPILEFQIIVPLGISYYTLQGISYLVDVSRGRITAQRNLGKLALYLSYFPIIVQGPISRYDQLTPQLWGPPAKFHWDILHHNLLLILFGLVKKIVIADKIAIFANYCFSGYENLSGIVLYLGAIAYAIQLYMDFSGCVDICRGVSGLFGIQLINNFRMPYFSHSIKEFWQRWHISLSSWLRDYIYIPLGGNRFGILTKYRNLVITFLVSGIWHGAGFNYIAWGMLHAFYQIAGSSKLKVFSSRIKNAIGIQSGSLSERIYQVLVTFHLVTFAWIFFRANGVRDAFRYIVNMIKNPSLMAIFDGSLFQCGIDFRAFVVLFLNIGIVFFLEHFQLKYKKSVIQTVQSLHFILRWIVYGILLFDILLFGAYGVGFDGTSFLYGGF